MAQKRKLRLAQRCRHLHSQLGTSPTVKGERWPEEVSCLTPGSDHSRTIESAQPLKKRAVGCSLLSMLEESVSFYAILQSRLEVSCAA
jgi:hypothetical protein